jgi:serine/threonine-protein kinase
MTKKKLPYLGAILCALALLGAKPATAGPYGALATSPQADFGFSYNFDDEDSAQDRALSECQKHSDKCTVKGTFQNTCVSVAKASNGAMGWAWGHGKRDDDRMAMSECRKNRGRDCELARRFCTGDP